MTSAQNMTGEIENRITMKKVEIDFFYIFVEKRPLATFWSNIEGLTPSTSEVMMC